MIGREALLHRVKQAVAAGNRPGTTPLPQRGKIGYQGGGADPVARFAQELQAAGGQAHRATDAEAAKAVLMDLLQKHDAAKVFLSRGGLVEQLGIETLLADRGCTVTFPDTSPQAKDDYFAADVGITNVAYLIAETGTLVMASQPDEPRSASLLPPIHIALAHRSQLLPDLFDLFDLFSPVEGKGSPPSCLTLITGPSKTGDIELKLVTGVHGPGELHVVVGEW
jgi:L-lactate utilization protein LutC